jgi:hypothetical protein
MNRAEIPVARTGLSRCACGSIGLGLLALLGVGLPAPLAAEGRIQFAKMAITDCAEIGACEWRLACTVGSGAETELVPYAESASPGEVKIDRVVEVPTFPVTVKCQLQEDDGWLGKSWNDAGSASFEVPGGGDYKIVLKNPEQGAAEVSLLVDSLEIGAAPAAPAPAAGAKGKAAPAATTKGPVPGSTFLSVYQSWRHGHAVLVGYPWDQFSARTEAFKAKGVMLASFGSYPAGGQRLWFGIFRSGPEKQEVVPGLEWEAFTKKVKSLSDSGLWLTHLAIYSDAKGAKRYFSGVFHEGGEQNTISVGQERAAFRNKWVELSGNGQRLIDLETYKAAGGKNLYASIFAPGSGSYGIWPALDWDALAAKWRSSSSSQIADAVSYVEGGKRLFDVVLGSGEQSSLEAPATLPTVVARWKEMVAKGMRLNDLDPLE